MNINKALITAAGPDQRKLPLQTLIDPNREKKTVLEILIDEISATGIEEIGVVVHPDDVNSFQQVLGNSRNKVVFIPQNNPKGYGHALLSAASFLNNEPFLHLVGDHLYINRSGENVAQQVVNLAQKYNCSVSAVQSTRENMIGNYGTVGARRLNAQSNIFQLTEVYEKPTPTYAEQHLMIPGFRAGYYLCFFGVHVFTPLVLELLEKKAREFPTQKLGLSDTLHHVAEKSKYLAIEKNDLRYDIGLDYGLLKAQLALSLKGKDREYILSELVQFFVEKEMTNKGGN